MQKSAAGIFHSLMTSNKNPNEIKGNENTTESYFKSAEIKIKDDCIWKIWPSLNFLRCKNVCTCFNFWEVLLPPGSSFINLIVTAESV